MYQVFNMGCRMEIYTDADFAEKIISLASTFNIEAQIIGRVEKSEKKFLLIKTENGELEF
jgi:phosphoribosylformylglycinamidine cyclo-ligase